MVVYAVVLAIRGPMNPETVFPFARWELFSRVPLEVTTSVSVRLIEVDGVVLDPPLYFDESEEHVDQPRSAVAAALMEQLGAGLRDGDVAKAARAQAQLESRFMPDIGSARYEVVLRSFRPLDRHRCDCFLSEEVLATLTKDPPP